MILAKVNNTPTSPPKPHWNKLDDSLPKFGFAVDVCLKQPFSKRCKSKSLIYSFPSFVSHVSSSSFIPLLRTYLIKPMFSRLHFKRFVFSNYALRKPAHVIYRECLGRKNWNLRKHQPINNWQTFKYSICERTQTSISRSVKISALLHRFLKYLVRPQVKNLWSILVMWPGFCDQTFGSPTHGCST